MSETLERKQMEHLLRKATSAERRELGTILDFELKREWGAKEQGVELVKQLYWKYQTPLGYVTRDPAFDEICVDVAKQLKREGLAEKHKPCWPLLREILLTLFRELYEKLSPEEREEWVTGVLKEEIEAGKFSVTDRDWSKLTAGVMLKTIQRLGGFTIYKVTLMVVNQVAKAIVGRGLSLAANAFVSRAVSFALGPVGWALMVWGINDVFGTNWKRVVPAVLFMYCIHERLTLEQQSPSTRRTK